MGSPSTPSARVSWRPTCSPACRRQRGVRIVSDDARAGGERLELDAFLPDDTTLSAKGEVMWVNALPEGSPARFAVGVRFEQMDEHDRSRLAEVLEHEAPTG